ncbi:MAG: hypothetical protein LE169_06020 [Endomicrobium sp.]|nr:hypothetical protein [Endomicrobium sp.]
MKRIISLLLVAILVSGCGRLQSGGNAENFDDVSGVGKHTHTPLSSDPANLPVPTPPTNPAKSPALAPQSSNASASELQPMPSPTVSVKPDLNPLEELCGGRKKDYLYFGHSVLSYFVNSTLILVVSEFPSLYFLRILRMFSVFSFPVHVYLTNPSFLSKSKLSLSLLAVDTCLSLFKLNQGVFFAHLILELVRFYAYPHIAGSLL